jgi:polysaccharide biosynthesis transport protein
MNQMSNLPPQAIADLRGAPAGGGFGPSGPNGPVNSAMPAWQAPAETPEIVELWRAVRQRMWGVLALGLLCAGIAAFVVTQMRPVYQSSATVLIESAPTKVVSQIEDVYSGVANNREHFQTQAEVMKSRDIAQRVIDRLKLAEHPEFDPRQQTPPVWRTWLQTNLPAVSEGLFDPAVPTDSASVRQAVLREYGTRLSVEPVRLSQLVRVRFEAQDPALAAAAANAVGEAYIQQDRENRMALTSGAGTWIRDRLAELKKKLDVSEGSLQAYRDREGLLDSKSTVLGGTGRQMDELTNRLVEAGVRRSMAEEAFKQIKAGEATQYESVPAVVRAPSVQNAKAIENELGKKLAEVSQRYGPDHPRHVAAASELASARANTQRETRTIVESVIKEYQAAVATEKSIEGQLQQSKGTIQTLNRKEIQLSALEREAATNRQLYETFLTRYGETTATRDAQTANARVVDRASPAINPVRPKKAQVVGVALAGGILAGVLGAIFLSRLKNTVKTTGDVESKLQQPFLAALPLIGLLQRKHAARMVLEHPGDLFAEGVRTASTGVMLSALDSPQKVVAVTSSVPGEGKSTFAVNWALNLAKSKRTLLIEADLRRPSVAKSLSLKGVETGLSDVVAGEVTLEAALQTVEGSPLQVLTAGKAPPDPLDLLASLRFANLVADLRLQYDVIVIDCPPVQLVSDALVVGRLTNGLIYLVKADDTPLAMAKTGLKRVVSSGTKVIGVVLNQHDFKKAERYYGESYGYGKYSYKKYGYSKV